MVAGATGIDLFLLVVDAAEGARPQTHEHLAILRLLGDRARGRRAVTKADAVDAETLRARARGGARARARARRSSRSRARRRARGSTSCGRRSPTCRRPRRAARRACKPTRLLRRPGLHAARDRHGRHRHALVGLDRRRRRAARRAGRARRPRPERAGARPAGRAGGGRPAGRGRAPGSRAARRCGAATRSSSRAPIRSATGSTSRSTSSSRSPTDARLHVHHGTAEHYARLVRVGERYAQLRLASPVVAARGDRVVLRDRTTVGGGLVLDPAPPRPHDRGAPRAARAGRPGLDRPARSPPPSRCGERISPRARCSLPPSWTRACGQPSRQATGTSRRSGSRSSSSGVVRALDERAASSPLDPGMAVAELLPRRPWASALVPLLPARAARREGVRARARRARSASAPTRPSGSRASSPRPASTPVRVDDGELARFLEREGRLVRLGDGLAVGAAAYDEARRTRSSRSARPRARSRWPASATSRQRAASPPSSCSSASTRTGSRAASATSACSGAARAPDRAALRLPRSGTGPVAQPVFKTGEAWQPHAG